QTLSITFMVASLQTSADSLGRVVDLTPGPGELPGVWQQFFGPAAHPDGNTPATYVQYLAQVGDREGLSIIVAGSDAYFQKAGRNPRQWVINLYKDYFNVTPVGSPKVTVPAPPPLTEALIQRWLGLLSRGATRTAVARAIITDPANNHA